jgi:hypothetical protein
MRCDALQVPLIAKANGITTPVIDIFTGMGGSPVSELTFRSLCAHVGVGVGVAAGVL